MSKLLSVMLAVGTLSLLGSPARADPVQAATKAAKEWLALVDAGKYGQSWEHAARFFKKNVSREQWEKAVRQVRGATGPYVSRKLKSAVLTKELPGAPAGQYVVIQFEAVFKNKKDAVETITPMLENDKKWRIAGYFIR